MMKAHTAKILEMKDFVDNAVKTPTERFMEYLKNNNEYAYNELSKSPEKINDPRYKEVRAEFEKNDRFDSLINEISLIKKYNKAGDAEKLYEQYLAEESISDKLYRSNIKF